MLFEVYHGNYSLLFISLNKTYADLYSKLLELNPDNIDLRKIQQAVLCMKKGGIIIYPTDTVYGLGCDVTNRDAVERICKIKGVKPEKMHFSFICNDLSHISEYTLNLSTPIYKIMRKALPGPFTFILKANNNIPKLFKNNKKTIGIRIPDNSISRTLVETLGNPILSTSIHHEDEVLDYITDPMAIYDRFKNIVDYVIDGGVGGYIPSTVIDCTSGTPELIRQGKGQVEDVL